MPTADSSIDQFLAGLPEDRRAAVEALRSVILKNLPKGYEEGIQYGGIGYFVPHSIFPGGYHCNPKEPLPFLTLVNQKNYISLHMMGLYCEPEEVGKFKEAFAATGKRLDMGAGCVRFKKIDDIPFELLGETIARFPVERFVGTYTGILSQMKSRKKKG